MPERPRLFLDTKETSSTDYVELLNVKVSGDCKGISFFSVSIDPDPNARYEMHIAKIVDVVDLELTAMWSAVFQHLTSGVYAGFRAGDSILFRHKAVNGGIKIKTGITLAFNEVIGVIC